VTVVADADGVRTVEGGAGVGAGVGEGTGLGGGATVVGGVDVDVVGADVPVDPVTLADGVAVAFALSGAVTPPPQEINKDTPAVRMASL
jgi:hypothetical protein